MTFIFDIAFLTFLLYFGHLICSIPFAIAVLRCCFDCCICREGQRVRVPLTLRLSRLLFYGHLRTFI